MTGPSAAHDADGNVQRDAADVTASYDERTSPYVPAAPGTLQIRGYEILGELGQGGMGVVYKARQIALNRVVALKSILAGASARPKERARFRSEAEAIARLQHPNIVQIYEIGEQDGVPFFSLEFVSGGSLDTWLNGVPLPPRDAASLLATLARAVQAAHVQGIVHRDLKPANVLLQNAESLQDSAFRIPPSAVPKITDFGLAKQLESDSGQTQSGAIMGTPSYMAPEQAEGRTREGAPAMDIYSLGAILYETLTGRPPFRAASAVQTIQQVCQADPVPPCRLQPQLPRDLETICLKCLEKEPGRRYATAVALANDLERFLRGEPIHARPVGALERGRKWVKRQPVIASLLAAVVAVTVIGFALVVWQYLEARAAQGRAETARDDEADQKHRAEEALAKVEVQRTRAQKAEGEAKDRALAEEHQRQQVETVQYANQLALAQTNLRMGTLSQADAVLDLCPRLLRGWEWHYLKAQGRASLARCTAHVRAVNAVAFEPTGRSFATVGEDTYVKVWETKSGRILAVLSDSAGQRHTSLAFGGSGGYLVAANDQFAINVWPIPRDTEFGEPFQLTGHKSAVHRLFLKRQMLVSCDDTSVRLWNLQDKKQLWSAEVGARPLDITFGPSEKRIVVLLPDLRLKEFETESGKEAELTAGTEIPVPSGAQTYSARAGALEAGGQRAAWVDEAGVLWEWNRLVRQKQYGRQIAGKHVTSIVFGGGLQIATCDEELGVNIWDYAGEQPVLSLRAHADLARSLAIHFGRDAHVLAAGAMGNYVDDAAVTIWDLDRDPEARVLQFHRRDDPPFVHLSYVTSVPGSPHVIAQTGTEGYLWDQDKDQEIAQLPGRMELVSGARVDPTGTLLACSDQNGSVSVWNLKDRKQLFTLPKAAQRITSLAFSPTGDRLVTGGDDSPPTVWNTSTGKEVFAYKGHKGATRALAYSHDGSKVASSSADNSVRIWESSTGTDRCVLAGLADVVSVLLFTSDDKTLIGGIGKEIRYWDAETGTEKAVLAGHDDFVQTLALHPERTRLASGSKREVKLWDSALGREVLTLKEGAKRELAFRGDGKILLTAGFRCRLWNAEHPQLPAVFPSPSAAVTDVGFHPETGALVTTGYDGMVRIWDQEAGRTLAVFRAHDWSAYHVRFGEGGKLLVTGSSDGTAKVWDFASRKLVSTFSAHGDIVQKLDVAPDGQRAASVDSTGVAKVWKLTTTEELASFKTHDAPVTALIFHPDGKSLITTSRDKTAKLWDAATGELLRTFSGHTAGVSDAAFSADGAHLATSGRDNAVILWNTKTGEKLRTLTGHESFVWAVAFSPDGKRLASGTASGTIRIWDPSSGKELQLLKNSDSPINALRFSADGSHLAAATGTARGQVDLWEVR